MTLYGLKLTHIFIVSFLSQIWAAVQLVRHDGPWWVPIVLWLALGWSFGQWRRHADNPGGLPGPAFFLMILVPVASIALAVWGVVVEL